MEDKYYTPRLDEFHVGFEYEHYLTPSEFVDGAGWLRCIFPNDPFVGSGILRMKSFENIRVKYLDSSDIESLGFKKSNKNSWCGYKDYFLDSINPEYPYFLFATIHIPIRDDMYKILVHRYYNEDESIDEDDNYREPTTVFVGKIKNKSELNQLLKRLNIINE